MLIMGDWNMAYGRWGGGRRRRNSYCHAGMPGWVSFGYSPAWVGGGPTGVPPAGHYLMQTGQMIQPYLRESPTQILVPTHGRCANFRDGFCALYGTAVDPNGPACPRFTPKSPTPIPQSQPMRPMFRVREGFSAEPVT